MTVADVQLLSFCGGRGDGWRNGGRVARYQLICVIRKAGAIAAGTAPVADPHADERQITLADVTLKSLPDRRAENRECAPDELVISMPLNRDMVRRWFTICKKR